MPKKIKIDPVKLKRKKTDAEDAEVRKPESVSAGPVDRVIELAFNPSREKIREMTIVDRIQGRLFPLLDVINIGCRHILEVAQYRQSASEYKRIFKQNAPIPPNLLDEYMFRSAQWQKSVAGKNLERATDIALAETEAKAGEEEEVGVKEPYAD